MPVKVKLGDFRSPLFMQAVAKLAAHNFKDQKAAYNVMRLLKKIQSEGELAQAQFIKLVKQHAKLDDKGNFVPIDDDPKNKDTYQIPDENQETWKTALKDFQELEVTIERYPIKIEDLNGSALTPGDLMLLETMLEGE